MSCLVPSCVGSILAIFLVCGWLSLAIVCRLAVLALIDFQSFCLFVASCTISVESWTLFEPPTSVFGGELDVI